MALIGRRALMPEAIAAGASRSCAAAPAAVGDAIDPSQKYRLVLNEKFTRWTPNPDGAQTDVTQWYTATPWPFGDNTWISANHPNTPFSIGPEGLTIKAKNPTPKDSSKWTSGVLCSTKDAEASAGFTVTRGYYEATFKVQDVAGTWPGFWLNTVVPIGRPAKGYALEIDVIEYYGHDHTKFASTVHYHVPYPWGDDENQLGRWFTTAPAGFIKNFHSYGLEITASDIVFYFDRMAWFRTSTGESTSSGLLRYPWAVLAQLAIGSGWPAPTVSEVAMVIKDIQIWS
jgi:beta-glucanase (GH16 family)